MKNPAHRVMEAIGAPYGWKREGVNRQRHRPAPAGSKLLKGFYTAKHGAKPDSLKEARAWYAGLQEPKYRVGESKKRIAALEAK